MASITTTTSSTSSSTPSLLCSAVSSSSRAFSRSIKPRRSVQRLVIVSSLIQKNGQNSLKSRNRLVPIASSSSSASAAAAAAAAIVPPPGGRVVPHVLPESEVPGLTQFLDTLKFDSNGMLVAIVQHIDTGELLMQAFADRAAVAETLQTGLATFRSRSRGGRWCKGETSGAYLLVSSVHADCDGDSLVYLSDPVGPACHTGAPSCWFSVAEVAAEAGDGGGEGEGKGDVVAASVASRAGDRSAAPLPTLLSLERTIAQRAAEAAEASSSTSPSGNNDKPKPPSWTAKLLADEKLLCSKVREEADELARALEASEGKERVASEAADLLYHAAVLLNAAGVGMEDVGAVLRKRFGTSGVVEKASRKK